jgi:hypothetical protein
LQASGLASYSIIEIGCPCAVGPCPPNLRYREGSIDAELIEIPGVLNRVVEIVAVGDQIALAVAVFIL